jgi:hypothetical protein
LSTSGKNSNVCSTPPPGTRGKALPQPVLVCHACTASGQACQLWDGAALTKTANYLELDHEESRVPLAGLPRQAGASLAPRVQTMSPKINKANALVMPRSPCAGTGDPFDDDAGDNIFPVIAERPSLGSA